MHIRLSNNNYLYSMNGQTLNEVAELKDLRPQSSQPLSACVQQSQQDAGPDQVYNQAQEYHSHVTTIQKLG